MALKSMLILGLLAFLVRIGRLFCADGIETLALVEDSETYLSMARLLVETGAFLVEPDPGITAPMSERMPGYLMLLATGKIVLGEMIWPTIIFQAILDSVTVMLIASIGACASTRIGLIAGILAALWPNLIIHSNQILTDTTYVFFIACFLFSTIKILERPEVGRMTICAASLSLATLVRAVSWPLLTMLPVIVFFSLLFRNVGTKRALALSIIFLIVALIPLSPWLARNYAMFGSPQLTSQGGSYVSGWVVPEVLAYEHGTTRSLEAVSLRSNIEAAYLKETGRPLSTQSRITISNEYQRRAMDVFWQQSTFAITYVWAKGMAINFLAPAILLDMEVRRTGHELEAKLSSENIVEASIIKRLELRWSAAGIGYRTVLMIAFAGTIFVSGLQLVGFCRSVKIWPKVTLISVAFVLYFLLVTGPIISAKYRLPIEPILIVWAAIGVDACLRYITDKSRKIGPFSN